MEGISEHEENKKNIVRKYLEEELRKNGFGFQYAVVKKVNELFQNSSAFFPEVVEFPISIQGKESKIDLILRRYPNHKSGYNPFIIIGECKRANPAWSTWCFIQTPSFRNNHIENLSLGNSSKSLFLESFEPKLKTQESDVLEMNHLFTKVSQNSSDFFDLSFAIKTNEKGENLAKGKDDIEDAVTQVLRGLNGFIDYSLNSSNWTSLAFEQSLNAKNWYNNSQKSLNDLSIIFLPVIFTTAELWASDIDLSNSDLEKGNVNLPKESLKKRDWILYQYNQSPSLRHPFNIRQDKDKLSDILELGFRRTVAIVNSSGIASFLQWASDLVVNETTMFRFQI